MKHNTLSLHNCISAEDIFMIGFGLREALSGLVDGVGNSGGSGVGFGLVV